MVIKSKKNSKAVNKKVMTDYKKVFLIVITTLFALVLVSTVILISKNKSTEITGNAFRDAGNGVQIAYWGMSQNYPLNLGSNTIQTEVKISSSTVKKLAAGYLVSDVAALITGYAGIAADVKTMLGGFVPDPVSAALILSDKFVNYLRSSASKCLKQVAIKYNGLEAHFVIATTTETQYSSMWGGNYIYARNTYYDKSGKYICDERSCAGFVYNNGQATTSCW